MTAMRETREEYPYCIGCGTIYDGHHDHCPVAEGRSDAVRAQAAYDRRNGQITPADLELLLASRRKLVRDAGGKCLHARRHYQDLGSVGRTVCPDCHDIDWHGTWPPAPRAPETESAARAAPRQEEPHE